MERMNTFPLTLIFWLCLGAVAYNYLGYPLVLFALATFAQAGSDLDFLLHRRSRRSSRGAQHLPRVAVLMSAYNEEAVIQAKVKNLLELDYPQDRLEILIGLDDPGDGTAEVLARTPSERLQVIHYRRRQGKLKVLFALARRTSCEILVVTDANTVLAPDCLRNLARHFADPRVGAVSGEETRVVAPGTDPGAESLYWRYESALKVLESRLNCSLGANGSVLAVRSSLFRLSKPSIVEDLQIPLDIRFQGHRVVYDPEAMATEEIAPTFAAQWARRVRVGTGNFQTLFGSLEYLDPRRGLPAFCYFSHRVLRWLAPVLLLAAFLCSLAMMARPAYAVLAGAQSAFYLMALLGFQRKKKGKPAGPFALPLHFSLMNLALLAGLLKYVSGRRSLVWVSTPRPAPGELRQRLSH
jgi:cellulose synthase/poly-beta-1,6-N-acetylglucosamine synthase-like glycosyltransferase